ncbi:MAG TPA: hypothetical protein VI318_14155 [Baekduia sp.]
MEIEIGDHPDRLTFTQAARLATDRAPRAPAGVGAFVTDTRVTGDRHDWTVAVSDGRAWAYVHAWGTGLGRWSRIDPTRVARAVEAAVPRRVPPQHRVDALRRLGPVRVTPTSLGIAQRAPGEV